MVTSKADIINQLRKEILPLQGIKAGTNNSHLDNMLGPIRYAFPNATFPSGSIHEFCYTGNEDAASTIGFTSAISGSLMRNGGATIWIGSARTIFPPALTTFGIAADKIIFIELKKEREMLWAMEEALKCEGLAAVIAEIPELNFTASRRLQLAVEQSRVTGFILRSNPRVLSTTACVTRWKITSLSSYAENNMPGVGFPRWNASLLKVRNGKPGSWQIEWAAGKMRHISGVEVMMQEQKKKAV